MTNTFFLFSIFIVIIIILFLKKVNYIIFGVQLLIRSFLLTLVFFKYFIIKTPLHNWTEFAGEILQDAN